MAVLNPVEKLRAIVGYMPGWDLEIDSDLVSYLCHQGSGTRLMVSHRGRARFVISVDWPQDYLGARMSGRRWGVLGPEAREPEITVAMNRSTQVLAADIVRRIGNLAIPWHTLAQARQQEQLEQASQAKALAADVGCMLGVRVPEPDRRQDRYRFNLYRIVAPGYGDIGIYGYAPMAVIELTSIDAELTRKIVAAIAEHYHSR